VELESRSRRLSQRRGVGTEAGRRHMCANKRVARMQRRTRGASGGTASGGRRYVGDDREEPALVFRVVRRDGSAEDGQVVAGRAERGLQTV
jgi:hypothetical protein